MNDQDVVEVLLVEDNPQDAELTIRALKRHNLANRLYHVEDGAEALDFLFGRGKYEGRRTDVSPKVVLLDLKLLLVDIDLAIQVCKLVLERPQLVVLSALRR